MKVYLTIFTLILICASSFNITKAQQIQKFSEDENVFANELLSFMEQSEEQKRKEVKLLMENFFSLWLNNTIDAERKKSIIELSNKMLNRRAQQFPHFNLFIQIQILFTSSNQDNSSYKAWHNGLVYLIDQRQATQSKITDYLNFTYYLLNNNSLYKSGSTEWRASNNNYKFVFDKTIKVIYNSFDLSCYAKHDSIKIYNTKGIYFPIDEFLWQGTSGKVTWERAGYDPNQVYATLSKYKINLSQALYTADTVTFYNNTYFNQPIIGKLEEKVTDVIQKENATYPRFYSYTKHFELKNIYKDVDYSGGFVMHGADIQGSGNEEKKATLYFYREGKLFLTASSNRFIFSNDKVTGTGTSVTFKLNTDSIYHPGLLFKYFINKREVICLRDKKGITNVPYFNTYHGVDMDFEMLTWKIDEPRMVFQPIVGATNRKAFFESSNYFSEKRYNELQGMDETNPLILLKKCAKQYQSDIFSAETFAKFIVKDINQVRQVLLNIAFLGLIIYDTENDEITCTKRLYDFIDYRMGRKDYDVINFVSNPENGENASLNLLNNDMKLYGVQRIQLSDSHNVVIFPDDQIITLKRNRDFEFHGKIIANLFLFTGKNFSFSYDQFKINLVDVDNMKMKVPLGKKDIYGRQPLITVRSNIENIKGNLLIDHPSNKSGVKDFAKYPIFNSEIDSYVYYDAKSIQNGIYKRDKFYFQIYPYSLDSLDDFNANNLAFKGYFVSAGIFPPFEENLTLQQDTSLGFIRSAPANGYPMYGGKGTYKADIKLSNKGLRGDGELNYVTSTTYSKDFIFYPDSMNTIANSYIIDKQSEGILFPDVVGDNVRIHWLPHSDQMFVSNTTQPIKMYTDQVNLEGTLKLQPTGLSGKGKMDFENASMTSNEYVYKDNTFDSDTSDFNLKGISGKDFLFKTNNVQAHIDFAERKGEFKSNGQGSVVEFPHNQYICFMDQFNWYMDQEELEISTSKTAQKEKTVNTENLSPLELEDIQLEGSNFISTHPQQDSLSWIAPSAKYSLNRHLITAQGVQFIRVADGTVYLDPNDQKVVIEKEAKMRTLKNAKIIANNTNRYHTIFNATVNIFGKKNYSASGDYNYIDALGEKQIIHFDLVSADSNLNTFAKGKIGITDNFKLSPNFSYTGSVLLSAREQFLTFSGSTKIAHECSAIGNSWINFTSEIDPKNIYIPISSEMKDINNFKIVSGFLIGKDSITLYPAFLSKPKKDNDISVLSADGFLTYDNPSGKYIIASKEKIIEFNRSGNYISMHRTVCNIYGEGKINFGANIGQVNLISVGNINSDINKNEISFEVMMGLHFLFPENILKKMAEDINKDAQLKSVSLSSNTFRKNLLEFLGETKGEAFYSQISSGPIKRWPEEISSLVFYLSSVSMKWNPKTSSYVSVGQIGVGSILKSQIFKYLDGQIEIKKKRTGDVLTIYLEIDKAHWYYFQYSGYLKTMSVCSSDPNFNTAIQELKSDARKIDGDKAKGIDKYELRAVGQTEKEKFLKQFSESK